jgi:hypothetical protein
VKRALLSHPRRRARAASAAIHRFASMTFSTISVSSQLACLYNAERLPPLGFAATLPVSRQLQPFNRRTGAHLKAPRRFPSADTPWASGHHIMAALSRAKPAIFAHEIKLDQRTTLIESLQISGMAEGVLTIKRDYFRIHNQTRRLSCNNYWL